MKMEEKRIIENIEMKLFASEESCAVFSVQDPEEDYCRYYRHRAHPLVSETEEEAPEPRVQTPTEQQVKLKRVPSVRIEGLDDCPLGPDLKEDMEFELEVFSPLNTPQSEQVVKTSGLPSFTPPQFASVASLKQVARVKWRRVGQQRTGLVVKDVICLPRGHLLAHPDRHGAPQGKERAAMGMTARITIYCGWSPSQMESRLVSHFHGQLGQRVCFTYLQCVQGSRALFVPDPPVEGWTGEQVLRICGHGPLYILLHNYTQSPTSELLSDSLCDWVESCGLPENNSADHPSIYAHLVKHYIYHRVASMAAQFTDCLDSGVDYGARCVPTGRHLHQL